MLSAENPPDPSCSCKISGLKGDGRAGEELALQEAADLVKPAGLDETQQSHFSIRDYVFTARSKDIGVNWPFPQCLLQLCLKHGVKDLLPRFEPPDFVRDQHCKRSVRSDHQYACKDGEKNVEESNSLEKDDASLWDLKDNHTKHKPSQSSGRSVVEVLDRGDENFCGLSKSLGLNEAGEKVDIASTLTADVEIISNSVPANKLTPSFHKANSISEASIEFEASEPPHSSNRTGILSESSDNKCQLIGKLAGVSESSQPEEIVSSSSALSEPMASIVCPVCKTFVSTSNTTLNAHMDQCLASESNCKEVLTDMTKCKVKLRKKRLMVDIYATAERCTLEDLDRRNGTSWAVDLSSPMTNDEICMESKRQRIVQVDVADDGQDEREVYVDSNGKKLRNLSKFNDKVVATVGDDFTQRINSKAKEGKILLGKKKRLGQKCSKLLKVEPQSKKLYSLRPYNGKITEELDEEYCMDNYEKEKSLSQLLKAKNQIKTAGSGTWRQWPSSKRSSLSKKSNNRDEHGFAGDQPLIESNLSTSGNFSAKRNHILKFSRLSENPATPRSTGAEILSNNIDNCERTSLRPHENNLHCLVKGSSRADGCMMNPPRSSGSYASPRSKRVEVKEGTTQRSPKLPESHQFSLKAKKSSTLRKGLLLGKPSYPFKHGKSSGNRKRLPFKKSQKGRYVAEANELIEGLLSDADDSYDWGIHNSTGTLGPSSVTQYKIRGTHKLNHLDDMMGSETEATTNEESTERDKLLESEKEDVSTSKQEENVISERLRLPVEHCSPNMASGYLEDGFNFHQENSSVTSSGPNSVGDECHQDDRDQSGSPASANSAMSPPPPTRSNFKWSGLEAPSLGPETQAKVRVSSSDSTAEATLTNAPDLGSGSAFPSSPRTEGAAKAKPDKENLEFTISAAKEPLKFSDDQPCCFSQKESISQGAAVSYQEFQLQRRLNGLVATLNSNTRAEVCPSFSSGTGSQIDEMAFPALDSPAGSSLTGASSNASMKLQTCRDFSLGSPSSQTLPSPSSTCSSIRLMGKDVMVMSKGEDESTIDPKYPPAVLNDHQNSKYLNLLGFSISASQAPKPMSDVIVLDDFPEPGLSSHSVDAEYIVGLRGNQPLPMGISPLPVSNFDSRSIDVFSCLTPSSTFSTELSSGPKPSFLMSCPGMNPSSSKQGSGVAEGLGFLSPVPCILPSPATGYLNSMPYYSPSLW